ncbi:MAG: phosphoribosyltransferase family protein [Nibricoccus sp.]
MSAPSFRPLRTLPPHLELLYPRSAINARLETLAEEIDAWAAESLLFTQQSLLAVCVLRGGVFFFSDLLQHMRQSVEPGFCRASSYSPAKNDSPENTLQLDWHGLKATGRDVLLVDNICDSGRTLATCQQTLVAGGAHSVRTVVCVHRHRDDSTHTPTLAGFAYEGTEWLAGYGLRDRQNCMNHPEIYRVRAAA